MRTQDYVIFKSSSISGILGHLIKQAFELLNRNKGFPGGSVVKNLPAVQVDAGDMGSIPESERSLGVGNGNTLSILAWKISWTEEPGRLQSIGLQRVGYNSSN